MSEGRSAKTPEVARFSTLKTERILGYQIRPAMSFNQRVVGSIPTALTKKGQLDQDIGPLEARASSHESCLWAQSWALFAFAMTPSSGSAFRMRAASAKPSARSARHAPGGRAAFQRRSWKSAPAFSVLSSRGSSASPGSPWTRPPPNAVACGRCCRSQPIVSRCYDLVLRCQPKSVL